MQQYTFKGKDLSHLCNGCNLGMALMSKNYIINHNYNFYLIFIILILFLFYFYVIFTGTHFHYFGLLSWFRGWFGVVPGGSSRFRLAGSG